MSQPSVTFSTRHTLGLALVSTALALLLSGCIFGSLPSQQHPVCSWSTQPPANADSLCGIAFDTLTKIALASEHGNTTTIRQVVTNPRVANRILAFAALERGKHAHNLHIVPSFTLEITDQGLLGAGFYVLGKDDGGNVNSPETLYLKVHGKHASVVQDQPNQDW